LMNFVGLKSIADIQNRLFSHITKMDNAFFDHNTTGRLVSKFTVDCMTMRNAITNSVTGIVKDSLSVFFLIGLMFYSSLEMSLALVILFPLGFYPVILFGKRMRKVTINTQEEMGLFNAILEQTFQGIRIVKSYCMEKYERSRITKIVEQLF